MDFYQLSYFKKVVETGSLSRAAEELFITQPAVSKQIRALEEELGQRLFDRIGKKVHLTRAGKVLYEHAGKILRSVDEAKTSLKELSGDCSGELIIGTSDHISIHRLPDVLKAYIAAFPKVELKLRCHRSETVLDMVIANQVDIGVITLPHEAPNVVSRIIWRDPMSLVMSRSHPLSAIKNLRLPDAAKYDMILPEVGTTTRRTIDLAFAKMRLSPRVTMEVAYIETIKSLVKAGLGISILPDKAVEQEIRSGAMLRLRIKDADFHRNLGYIHLSGKFLSRPAVEFLKLLEKKSISQMPGGGLQKKTVCVKKPQLS